MTRTRLVVVVGIPIIICLLAVTGLALWRWHMKDHDNLTLDQAGRIADRYTADTVAHIPGGPRLSRTSRTSLPCDDPADRAPAGTADLVDMYTLSFDSHPENNEVFDRLKAFWVGKGYKVIDEDPATLPTRTLTVENPSDGFRVGLVQGVSGNLALNVSSPCLPPGSATPTP